MKLLQFTDLHVRPEGRLAYQRVDTNALVLHGCQAAANFGAPVDAIVMTGDLTDCGLDEEYAQLKDRLALLAPVPVYLIPGNHDRREGMLRAFPHMPAPGGFLNHAVDDLPARLILLDSIVAGATHGHLCETRLTWLQETLREQPHRDTMIAMHHPPLLTGVRQFDDIILDNPDAFKAIVAANPQVTRIICGHHHRMILGNIAQAVCVVAPSISYQFALMHDPALPEGFVMEPPAFLLHSWSAEGGFITHTLYPGPYDGPFPVLLEPEYPG